MKKTVQIILAMVGLLVAPALVIAQSWVNPSHDKIIFVQNHPVINQGKRLLNTVNATNSTTITRLHGKADTYTWDSTHNKWKWEYQDITKYDNRGRIILEVHISDTTANDTTYKTTTGYSANGSSFSVTYYSNGTSLVATSIDSALNDSHGYETRSVSYYYFANKWRLSYGGKFNLTYDANGNVTSEVEQDYSGSKWVNLEENDYIVNADGSWKTWTQKEWNGSAWFNSHQYDSISWESWNGWYNYTNTIFFGSNGTKLSSAIVKYWDGTAWLDTGRLSATFDANGGSVITAQYYISGNYMNVERLSNLVDNKGNSTGTEIDTFNGISWVQVDGQKIILTYDASDNITQEIDQNYDKKSAQYINDLKYIYSNFTIVAGIKEANRLNAQISIYPNPATETLHLQKNSTTPGSTDISIYNLQGQKVLNKQINNNELSAGLNVDLTNLANGIYILRTLSNCEETNQKFVKE